MSPQLVRRALLVPIERGRITPSDSRLLAYMADVVDDDGEFYEARAKTCAALTMDTSSVKEGLRRLIAAGYIVEVHAAVKGKRTRRVRLLPESWPQPSAKGSAARGAQAVRQAMAAARTG